jgi:chemotaxis protein CheD
VTAPGRVHVLHPGDVVLAEAGDRLQTLLGSCVSVVLTDPRRRIGVMCHVVHAHGERRTPTAGPVPDTAWGEPALHAMYGLLQARGFTPRFCHAWAFGGGHMFPGLGRGAGDVGRVNARWVLQALARDGLQLLHHDLGGSAYRRLSWTVGLEPPQVQAVPMQDPAAPQAGSARPGPLRAEAAG